MTTTTPTVNSGQGALPPVGDVTGKGVPGEHPYTYVEKPPVRETHCITGAGSVPRTGR